MIKFKVIINDNSEKEFEVKDEYSKVIHRMIKYNSCEGIQCISCPIFPICHEKSICHNLKFKNVKRIELIPFSPEIKQEPKATIQDFKTQADIPKALLDGKTIVSGNIEFKIIDVLDKIATIQTKKENMGEQMDIEKANKVTGLVNKIDELERELLTLLT